jgi:nucleoside-diphosphate kinase
MEESLILIKPDAVERNLIGQILAVYEQGGLKVSRLAMVQIDAVIAGRHYAEHMGRPYFEGLVRYITRSPLVALTVSGEQAVELVRFLNGATDPAEAAPDSIRGRFGLSKRENSVHASDSAASAVREIAIWFP